nr:hypothetical protein [Streptomyces cyaneogriseus]
MHNGTDLYALDINGDRELITGDITPYLEWQRVALAESVPFEEYAKGLDV